MLTITLPVRDVDLFGEAVLRYGSDRTFVEESSTSPLGVDAVTYDGQLFFDLTAGLSFIYTFDEVESSVSFAGQYLYNGEGYKDPSVLADNPLGIAALIGAGDLSPSDLANTGRHYAAANVGWNSILGSDVSLGAFWIHNFSDSSGYVAPSVSVSILDRLSASARLSYRYGDEGDEYTPTGDGMTVSLSASFGGGSF